MLGHSNRCVAEKTERIAENFMKNLFLSAGSLALLALASHHAQAQTTVTDTVQYSSYVQNKVNGAGSGYVATSPGTGTAAGKYFTNDSNVDTEGPGTGTPSQYAAYSVLDFGQAYSFAVPVATLNNLALNITEYAAGFGTANPVDVYLVSNNTVSDYYSATAANNSPLFYDTTTAGTNPQGIGTQLGTTYLLAGSVPYSAAKNQTDSISLTPTAAASTLITSELNSGSDIRLVITQDTSAPSGAAEYDGSYYANKATGASPLNLSFGALDAQGNADPGTPVSPSPEPSQLGLLALMSLGLGVLIVRARQRGNSAAS